MLMVVPGGATAAAGTLAPSLSDHELAPPSEPGVFVSWTGPPPAPPW
eukprot:COSAG01_NODE_8675_length_2701_cov_55.451576_5_plen_46_part_01